MVGSGTSGAALLLNHTVGSGAIVHHEYTRPPELAARVLEKLGPPPARAMPNAAQNRRAVDAYLTLGLEEIRPDVTLMWISDPDTTAHTRGMGAGSHARRIDAGRHGDRAHRGHAEGEGAPRSDQPRHHVGSWILHPHGHVQARRAGGAVRPPDARRLAGHRRRGRRRPFPGAAPTPSGWPPSSPRCSGGRRWAPFSRAPARAADRKAWCPARCRLRWRGGIIRALPRFWSPPTGRREKNEAGYEGKTTQSGVAGHGASSPHDIHIPLMAAGPDFREHAVSDCADEQRRPGADTPAPAGPRGAADDDRPGDRGSFAERTATRLGPDQPRDRDGEDAGWGVRTDRAPHDRGRPHLSRFHRGETPARGRASAPR